MHFLSIIFMVLFTRGAELKKDAVPAVHHVVATAAAATICDSRHQLYDDCRLAGLVPYDAFAKCMDGYDKYKPAKHIVAICDFTRASNEKRFVVVDLDKKAVISNTWVAHGRNSGDLMATSFSNVMESHKSSKGFYRIGEQIQTALHGPSLLLDGLERGINDNARAREIIIHGAWYAAESFIKQYGYCGKSFGCPALPETAMKKLLPILANGALLYIYAK